MAGELQFEDAFEQLFTRSYHVAYRILGHSGEAEDVASDAMAKALRSWRKVRDMDAPEAWVVRVTTNLAIDTVRRNNRFADKAGSQGLSATVGESSSEIDARLDLHLLLRSLPRRQREVLALRYLADLSEAETAAILGIAQGTVKRHASRGILKMREEVLGIAS